MCEAALIHLARLPSKKQNTTFIGSMVNNVAGVNTNEEADDNGGNVMEHRFHN
jgi:hypothetical protein